MEQRCKQCVIEGNHGKCDKKNCLGYTPTESKGEWARFDEQFGKVELDGQNFLELQVCSDIKSFISNLLTSELTKQREGILAALESSGVLIQTLDKDEKRNLLIFGVSADVEGEVLGVFNETKFKSLISSLTNR